MAGADALLGGGCGTFESLSLVPSVAPPQLRVLPELIRPNSRVLRVPRPRWVMGAGKNRHRREFHPLHPPPLASWAGATVLKKLTFNPPEVMILGFFLGKHKRTPCSQHPLGGFIFPVGNFSQFSPKTQTRLFPLEFLVRSRELLAAISWCLKPG